MQKPRGPGRPTTGPSTRSRIGNSADGPSLDRSLTPGVAVGASVGDLGTLNEELISANEELRTMNEELETAKEELQSINEKLSAVNDELRVRNLEVVQVNSDLVNLLTTVDVPLLILDRERRIRRFTPRARTILNVLPADVGRPIEDLKTNLRVPDLEQQIAEVIETVNVKESEVEDAEGRWYRLQIRPYKTTDDRIDGAIVSLIDIDGLKRLVAEGERLNAEAVRANATKDQFLATLSHELRTPLSSMLMRAQLLRRGEMSPDKVQKTGEAIEAGIRLQVQLIDDLLDVSRIVSGRISLDVEPVDLGQLVAAATDRMTLGVERKGLCLEVAVEVTGEPVHVNGDQARLQQVVTNLLANAIKFTPSGGTVSVSLIVAGGRALIRVRDSGMGIDAALLPTIFTRFTQGDSTSTRTHGGLGLGLAIARHLVELHGGAITAASEGAGCGATFTVSLPVLVVAQAPTSPSAKAALENDPVDARALRGRRILVVDDDRSTRDVIADMLTQTGAEVRTADGSASAIGEVEAFRPELLVCDIEMPGEDGYALISRVRARGPSRSGAIPAIALTGLARRADTERALAAGFQLHLAKPVGINRLTEAVLALVPRRPG